jgi:hypothetical protein
MFNRSAGHSGMLRGEGDHMAAIGRLCGRSAFQIAMSHLGDEVSHEEEIHAVMAAFHLLYVQSRLFAVKQIHLLST